MISQVPAASADTFVSCSANDRAYTVVTGDTLSQIAARYETDVATLAAYNKIDHPDLIFVDQMLCIPGQAIANSAQTQSQLQSQPESAAIGAKLSTAQPADSNNVRAIIRQVFGSYGSQAINVATCESGLNPNAFNPNSINGSYPEGLFQVLYTSTWYTTSQAGLSPYDAHANTVAAHDIFVRDGYSWREWACRP